MGILLASKTERQFTYLFESGLKNPIAIPPIFRSTKENRANTEKLQ